MTDTARRSTTWLAQFTRSWRRFRARQDLLERSPDRMGDALLSVKSLAGVNKSWLDDDLRAMVGEAVRLRALNEVGRLALEVEHAAARCESPIELAMLSAFYVVAALQWDLVVMEPMGGWFGTRQLERPRESNYRLTIEPQMQLGDYRVDFLLTGAVRHYHLAEDGLLGAYSHTTERRMVVECDGFDYHDRTKEQASRDRERDRALQSLGYLVYRYTGGDIWADVSDMLNRR